MLNQLQNIFFGVFCMPVGPYFKGGLKPCKFIVSDEFDRAAPNGTGGKKLVVTMLQVFKLMNKAVEKGFADCIYLRSSNSY